jgi:hypothetical protein
MNTKESGVAEPQPKSFSRKKAQNAQNLYKYCQESKKLTDRGRKN